MTEVRADEAAAGDSELDALLRAALQDFARWMFSSAWLAKEHECVNLFAHRFLAARLRPGSALHDLTQMRIEGHVPQPTGVGAKKAVRKDLVFWTDPDTTCWHDERGDGRWVPHHRPLAVMEWKADLRGRKKPKLFAYDLAWLGAAARQWPGFVGYAVLIHRDGLLAARCEGDTCVAEWLRVPRHASREESKT
jgi:hypothetical protein